MSTELSQLGLDGEQQLGINPGSSEGGQQMGINPCPLSSPITPNGGGQMGINPCSNAIEDDKWESTHVRQTYLSEVCSHKNSGEKMGQGLQNLSILGSHNHNGV
jgi:hypothetical protein